MPTKVILDVNIWVYLLLSKSLHQINTLIDAGILEVLSCKELTDELFDVIERSKFAKIFTPTDTCLIAIALATLTTTVKIKLIHTGFTDAKDNYLFDLCQQYIPAYLVTGDKELLSVSRIGATQIISFTNFRELFYN